ncbi:predicted protein [Chaetoceros tenuissimus]|uniref:Uncharacterized protein n=1 Tax=Chaetoceros tenuissimus TaxID=426638 RepID=A0AAD3CVW7_9STRA|nr:predicted protein [Chaetoceros tenuissimus]GFH45870.1 predicted protein [Chaetoceros tenuissimus]GFH53138.1 predicted protein [Chaetoceros tenuissimus]GFH53141.1 predicted protein [Chaetoceros tenuissimus]GFH53837.1 predicted protein [Chaetoceros tenuissimus]
MSTNEVFSSSKICELVWCTLKHEETFIHNCLGKELKYYIAGSFATFLHNGKYLYNDIDVFVIDFSTDKIVEVDESLSYKIKDSYKVPLKDKDGCIFMNSKCKKLNVVFVKQCSSIHHLLKFFDINCCQVGYELNMVNGNLGGVVITEDYKSFLSSRVLEVVTFETPATSLCRLLKKSHDLGLPKKMSAVHLLKLKFSSDSFNCVNRGLFHEVATIMKRDYQKRRFMEYFNTTIISPSEEEINEDFYDHGEYGELSASMSFLIKNGKGVKVMFEGRIRKMLHYICIHGDVDEFSNFRRLVEKKDVLDVFAEKDDLNLYPIDYLLSHSSSFAIKANNFLITQLLGC